MRLYRRVNRTKTGSIELGIERVPQDCWIGVYWKRSEFGSRGWRTQRLRVYVCIVPCFPIIFTKDQDIL